MKTVVTLATFAFIMFASPQPGNAAEQKNCNDMELKKTGILAGEGKSIGFIIGVRWGSGYVRMDDGRTFRFKAKGVKPMEMGAAKVSFRGVVYNLEKPEDFAGFYAGLATGVTIGKGIGGAAFQNTKTCVAIEIKREAAKGLQGSLPMLTGIHVELAN